jgi:hypothetical protein
MLAELKGSGKWWHYGMPGHMERPTGTLLLLDRCSFDPVTPALHFCTYQAMVNDMLDVNEGGFINMEIKGKKRDVLLSDKDDLWYQLKYKHMVDVASGLTASKDDILRRHPSTAKFVGGDKTGSTAEMATIAKALPEYTSQMDRVTQHQNLAQKCLARFSSKSNALLNMIQDVEQTLATGWDQDGDKLKLNAVVDEMMNYMVDDDAMVKMRLLVILVATQREKLPSASLERLCTAADIDQSQRKGIDALRALVAPQTGEQSSKDAI